MFGCFTFISSHKMKAYFCRYVAMPKSTFWRFRKMGQVNMCPLLGPRGKQLIRTHKRPPKMVCVCHVCFSFKLFLIFYLEQWANYILMPLLVYLAVPVFAQDTMAFQNSAALLEPGYVLRPDSSSVLRSPMNGVALSSWTYNSQPPVSASHVTKGFMHSFLSF